MVVITTVKDVVGTSIDPTQSGPTLCFAGSLPCPAFLPTCMHYRWRQAQPVGGKGMEKAMEKAG